MLDFDSSIESIFFLEIVISPRSVCDISNASCLRRGAGRTRKTLNIKQALECPTILPLIKLTPLLMNIQYSFIWESLWGGICLSNVCRWRWRVSLRNILFMPGNDSDSYVQRQPLSPHHFYFLFNFFFFNETRMLINHRPLSINISLESRLKVGPRWPLSARWPWSVLLDFKLRMSKF